MQTAEAIQNKVIKEMDRLSYKPIISAILKQVAAAVLGLLFSLSGLSDDFSPFGVAFAASAGKRRMFSASAGAAVGYLISLDSIRSLRYIAAILALNVILGALKSFPKVRSSNITQPAVVLVCVFVTGLALAFADKVTALSLLMCVSEGVLGGAASYVFKKSRMTVTMRGSLGMLTSKEATALVIVMSLLLLSVKELNIYGVYPSHIVSALLVLFSARYAREAGGAVVGIAAGLSVSFGSGDVLYLAYFAFGGLLAGAFSVYGRIVSFISFLAAGTVVQVLSSGGINPAMILETAIAGAVFLLIPGSLHKKIEQLLSPRVQAPILDSVRSDMTKRLNKASKASEDICISLGAVNDALSKRESLAFSTMCEETKNKVCAACGLYDTCWGESFEDTSDCFNTLICEKKEGKYLEYKTVPSHFASRCIRTEMVAASFNKLYAEYKLKKRYEDRVSEMHKLASEQFINVSGLLDSLSLHVCSSVRFDMDSAARSRAAASSFGLTAVSSCCVIDRYDRLSLDMTVKTPEGKIDVGGLTRRLSSVTGRKLELPETTRSERETALQFTEKAELRVQFAGAGMSAKDQKHSGDAWTAFHDDDGFFYAVICDGMGTGTEAAIAANLAVTLLEKLIKGGFGTEAAIRTVNTSLISKSGDECSVSLDLLEIDLYTGHVGFFKCGAAPTAVRKSGKLLEVNCPSLPLGILSSAEHSYGKGTLTDGDFVVMMSDGADEDDLIRIKSEMKRYRGEGLRRFADDLVSLLRSDVDGKYDDLTIVAVEINKNI